jgi:hypothetical protein
MPHMQTRLARLITSEPRKPSVAMSTAPDSAAVFRLYKANSPYADQLCFADYLNQSLRDGHPLTTQWAQAAANLDALIAAAALTESTTLYRATIGPFVDKYIVGSELNYPAYMSTSTDDQGLQRHFATAFRNLPAALLTIECEVGSHALDMELDASFGGHEREMLLPRGARFEVVSIREVADRQEMGRLMSPLYASSYTIIKLYQLRYCGAA